MSSGILRGVALLLACAAGCSGQGGPTPGPSVRPEPFVYVGTVTLIHNELPVDGDFFIGIALDSGDTVTAGLEGFVSWRLSPPPQTEEHRALVDAAHRLKVGDRVRAEGTRVNAYPVIQRLFILDRSGPPA